MYVGPCDLDPSAIYTIFVGIRWFSHVHYIYWQLRIYVIGTCVCVYATADKLLISHHMSGTENSDVICVRSRSICGPREKCPYAVFIKGYVIIV